MAGTTVKPASANGHVTVRGPKNAEIRAVTAAIAGVVNTYLDGTAGTHKMYTVTIKVTPMQV